MSSRQAVWLIRRLRRGQQQPQKPRPAIGELFPRPVEHPLKHTARVFSSFEDRSSKATATTWTSLELALSTAVVLALSASCSSLYSTNTTSSQQGVSFGWGGGSGGGNSPLPSPRSSSFRLTSSASKFEEDDVDVNKEQRVIAEETVAISEKDFDVSVRAVKGGRLYMEDAYFVGKGGRFVGVFDGHGGGDVSHHLRSTLYSRLQQQLKRKKWEDQDENTEEEYRPSVSSFVSALRAAFEAIESEVLAMEEMQYQGSTAVTVALHEGRDGSRTLVSGNVGDSRAILCRSGKAVELTRDHKPSDERERARIQALGAKIEWDNYSKVHRVKNLSLSRAIGDRFAKPAVSGEVEIKLFPVRQEDDFIVLASDGLWDVMTNEEVVQFVRRKMETLNPSGSLADGDIGRRLKEVRRKNMSRYVATEALRRGTGDNVCVVIVWLKPLDE